MQHAHNQEVASELAAERAAKAKLEDEQNRLKAALQETQAVVRKAEAERAAELARIADEESRARAALQQKLELAEAKRAAENALKAEEARKREEAARVAQERKITEARIAEDERAKAEKVRSADEAEKRSRETAARTAEMAREMPLTPALSTASRMQGLWETITGGLRKMDRAHFKEMKLRLTGAKESLTLSYYLQPQPKPLVVILNGTFSRAQNIYAEELERIYIRAGFNVMTFDSFFSRRFLMQTQLAAPGNLKAEADLSGRIIAAFLKEPGIRDSVTDVAAVGLSYGGGVVLQLSLLDQDHKLPFTLSRVQAYSVPVSFRDAIRLLDEFEGQPYLYDTLIPIVMKAYKSNQAMPSDTTPEMLEKIVGRGFRLDLPDTVECVDRLYCVPIIKARTYVLKTNYLGDLKAEAMDRESEAGAVSFKELFESWLVPYWDGTGHVSAADLVEMGELSKMMPLLNERAQIIIARNDPLDAPGAIEALEKISTKATLTILPSGGHLGFLHTEAVAGIVTGLFPTQTNAEADTQKIRTAPDGESK